MCKNTMSKLLWKLDKRMCECVDRKMRVDQRMEMREEAMVGRGGMSSNLNELILLNNNLYGCLNPNIGHVSGLTVLDLSSNSLSGPLRNPSIVVESGAA